MAIDHWVLLCFFAVVYLHAANYVILLNTICFHTLYCCDNPTFMCCCGLPVLGNAAHDEPSVQQRIVDLGGVELLLAQAHIEERSPWVREWALWAVRNLTEGSAAAQQAIG
jgi:hypothetical protein